MPNTFTAKHDYTRFKFVLLADQITDIVLEDQDLHVMFGFKLNKLYGDLSPILN